MAADRRSFNAANISFPLQIVIGIVATAITIYTSLGGIRSDLRDIQTRLELGRDIAKAQSTAQDERMAAVKASIDSTSATMKAAIEAVSKKQEFQALQIAELSDKITKLSATGRK
jgi:hypothetical protein